MPHMDSIHANKPVPTNHKVTLRANSKRFPYMTSIVTTTTITIIKTANCPTEIPITMESEYFTATTKITTARNAANNIRPLIPSR